MSFASLSSEQHAALDKLLDISSFTVDAGPALARIERLLADYHNGTLDAVTAFERIAFDITAALSIDARYFDHRESQYVIEKEILAKYAKKLPVHLRQHPQDAPASE